MPDIVQMDYLYISTYAKNNSIADLTPYIEDGTIDTASIDENLMKSGEIGERQSDSCIPVLFSQWGIILKSWRKPVWKFLPWTGPGVTLLNYVRL